MSARINFQKANKRLQLYKTCISLNELIEERTKIAITQWVPISRKLGWNWNRAMKNTIKHEEKSEYCDWTDFVFVRLKNALFIEIQWIEKNTHTERRVIIETVVYSTQLPYTYVAMSSYCYYGLCEGHLR